MSGIATVTLNAALDRTLHVDVLRRGGKSRVREEWAQAGGKGVNVARVLRALGVETRALVLVGGATGRTIARDLADDGLPATCIEAPGESRTCLEIVDTRGRATQLHGPGVEAGERELAEVAAALRGLPDTFGWVAVCGSLPPAMPHDAVARLVGAARARGLRVAVDTSGPALRHAWAAAPDLVRVNEAEFAEVGDAADGPTSPERGVVSRGALPFEAWERDGERWRVTPPAVREANAIGCGDAMLAGLLASLASGEGFADALRRGTALASADACCPRAGRTDVALAKRLEADVGIELRPQ
ncbi:MAG: 1-phosphofructokinase family hexose kinase [Myxococcota bacterium]